jgi:hypothetical protein
MPERHLRRRLLDASGGGVDGKRVVKTGAELRDAIAKKATDIEIVAHLDLTKTKVDNGRDGSQSLPPLEGAATKSIRVCRSHECGLHTVCRARSLASCKQHELSSHRYLDHTAGGLVPAHAARARTPAQV